MMSAMVKEKEGYHTLFVQIPEVVWEAICKQADETGASVTYLVIQALAKNWRIGKDQLPPPKRAGRPPKT